ncbi:DNA/pantothenate metabolism flavoprotein [Limihaloglobus sulfuriphilus]|uniref:DNA/pantothenate metabolism flavoprotein n=1 Tax=Limihaloglobus sulfuriphilus TaxID=1851148 RepID=A0A1Q2MBW2_9BACT|nr:phosphopantothenoylcysteine decarboxylase [Limihaloglobus sulfuriphilus]AQQ70149.1 DNA/pantothenate metabolism flavoprotein [Limihaloglobus sulfuriphilus]
MNILVTAGGTREHIDPVRYISNASSGNMGYSIARAAIQRGHNVNLVSANVSLTPPAGCRLTKVISAQDMFEAVKENFSECDCLIMAAAVADYTPAEPSPLKLKKSEDDMNIHLKPTVDILGWAGQNKTSQTLVGFALEDTDMFVRALEKKSRKAVDIIAVNSTESIAEKISTLHVNTGGDEWISFQQTDKLQIAQALIEIVELYIEDNL